MTENKETNKTFDPMKDEVWAMVYKTLVREKTEELGHEPSTAELEPELGKLKKLFHVEG